jgi:hypothetical protein
MIFLMRESTNMLTSTMATSAIGNGKHNRNSELISRDIAIHTILFNKELFTIVVANAHLICSVHCPFWFIFECLIGNM